MMKAQSVSVLKNIGLAILLILPFNSANAWPTRDHFNDVYEHCVTREGGLTNGVILKCTHKVLEEVQERLDDRVEHMSKTQEDFNRFNDRVKAFDQDQRASFLKGIENYKNSTVQICDFMGYYVGSPANPLCVMDLMVNLLTILERYD